MASAMLATIDPGFYISWWKPLIVVILLVIWVRLLTWVDKDAPLAHLPRDIINAGLFGGLILAYALFFFMPGFLIAIAVVVGLFAVDIGLYLFLRSRKIGLGDLGDQFNDWLATVTGRNKPQKVIAVAGKVLVMDKNGAPQPVPDGEAPERPPYDAAQALLTNPLRYGAEQIDLMAGDTCSVTYLIDGVRYEGDNMERNFGGSAVSYLKRVADMDMNERRKPQNGSFKTQLDGNKRDVLIKTFGSAAGESLRLMFDPKNRHNIKLDALGFIDSQLETVRTAINDGSGGVVILCAPKSQGLTSLAYAVIRSHDAFLHHIHTIERGVEEDLEGITQNSLPITATGAEEAKQVSWVLSQQPDVVMVTSLESSASAVDIAKFADEAHRVYVCLRAPNTFDAIRQWRKLVGDDALAMKNLKLVISGRLIRRLCSACKIGYSPDPATLRKLNMNPEEVGKLYMGRKEPIMDAKGKPVPCTFCHDLAYKGRFGVFEMFAIDDETRKVIISGGSDNQLKTVFRKQRGRLLQEMALAQVKAGETSVEEVLRVLKSDTPAGGQAPPAAEGGAARPPSTKPKPSSPQAPPGSRPARGTP